MKKIFLSLVLLFGSIVGSNAQLLYKISHKSLEKPSYIVGTYHLAPASFIDSIPGAKTVLDAVDVVCGEVVMSEMESRENQKKVKEAIMLPDGKALADVEFGDYQYFLVGDLHLMFKESYWMCGFNKDKGAVREEKSIDPSTVAEIART